MRHRRILITGGAGFIGSNLAVGLRRVDPGVQIVSLDNLRRRGSELNLPRLRDAGVTFRHGDVRNTADLVPFGEPYDLVVDCSAEPSAFAGRQGDAAFVVENNLLGTLNCLEIARTSNADFLFLSTSRVYPITQINSLNYGEHPTRFEWTADDKREGHTIEGIAETFPLNGARSLYGATKLASELLIQEYRRMFGFRAVITRLGTVAGPWQMGNSSQGVYTLWLLAHHFRRRLRYIGFGGKGKQVRDLLHIDDCIALLILQMEHIDRLDGQVFNVGGGAAATLSLLEATAICQKITGNRVEIDSEPSCRDDDIRIFVTDNSSITKALAWKPAHSPASILADSYHWILANEPALRRLQ